MEATEIYAYPRDSMPGTYARNSPENPDAVLSYNAPQPSLTSDTDAGGHVNPNYSFALVLKRTDSKTVVANINGKKYESDAAWNVLKACAAH
jgi:hypothetical protein